MTDIIALLDEADPVLRQMARLAYGGLARSLRPTARDRARHIVEDLPHASALAAVARRDPSNAVRKAALSLLGDRLSVLPTLRPIVEQIRASDSAAATASSPHAI